MGWFYSERKGELLATDLESAGVVALRIGRRLDQLSNWARSIRRDAMALYLATPDPGVPWYAKALVLAAG